MAAGLHLCALQWVFSHSSQNGTKEINNEIATLITYLDCRVLSHTWTSQVKVVQHILSIPTLCQSMFAASQAELAKNMLRSMPERAKAIIIGGDFGGTDLVRVDSEVHRPSFKDLKFQGHQPL